MGYVHTSAPAQIERYRNIGVWRCEGDAHLSVHAQYKSWSDASKWRREQLERWGQFKLRNPPIAKLTPERDIQGGVVDSHGQIGGWPVHESIHEPPLLAVECHCYQVKLCSL